MTARDDDVMTGDAASRTRGHNSSRHLVFNARTRLIGKRDNYTSISYLLIFLLLKSREKVHSLKNDGCFEIVDGINDYLKRKRLTISSELAIDCEGKQFLNVKLPVLFTELGVTDIFATASSP